MQYKFFEEPLLKFNEGEHICPKKGITDFKVFDFTSSGRRSNIFLGVVLPRECHDKTLTWINLCQGFISGKNDANKQTLFPPFCGFNQSSGFGTSINYDTEIIREINQREIKRIVEISNRDNRIEAATQLYYDQIEFLAHHKNVDVVLCVIPKLFEKTVVKHETTAADDTVNDNEGLLLETDFRRALKAKCMHLGKPLQLIKEHSLTASALVQDDATRAWNFCTALYYKANNTPWKLKLSEEAPNTCFAGISFYNSRDKQSIQTSMAQLFDESGKGIILRGNQVEVKEDRRPHLNGEQSYNLIQQGLREYKTVLGNLPSRLVVHKSSNYSPDETEGFISAVDELGISTISFVTILDSNFRLYRNGQYPPFRGSCLELTDKINVLYTRGSIEFYRTYPGSYVPQPIEVRLYETDESANRICEEILALTKLNWNNTQLDGKYPITLSSARAVGKILKYLPKDEKVQTRYSYYM